MVRRSLLFCQHSVKKMKPEPTDENVTYTVINGGSNNNHDILIDSIGYIYCERSSHYKPKRAIDSNKSHWRCSVRGKSCICYATVVCIDGQFQPGPVGHNHAPNPGKAARRQIMAKVIFVVNLLRPYWHCSGVFDHK